MYDKVKAFRRYLHQRPELGLDVKETSDYIRTILAPLKCELFEPIPNSVVAYFDFGKKQSLAFRSDMDALPVLEKSGCSFESLYKGRMHACGHDGHMAMLLGFALCVNDFDVAPDYNIVLVFQPGEETPGGAKPICDSGILKELSVKHIFGFHLWPMLPAGVISTRKDEMQARCSEINMIFYGKSVHVAKYQEGHNANLAACDCLLQLSQMEQSYAPESRHLLQFGRMQGGSIRNVVSGEATIEGTLRAFKDEIYDGLKQNIYQIKDKIEKKYQVKIDVEIDEGYPALCNDGEILEQIIQQGAKIELLAQPEMISEDFSYYLQEVPGVFFFLGTGTGIPLHASNFDFDEAILVKGVEMYCKLAYMHFK